jgi:hypothetical protein
LRLLTNKCAAFRCIWHTNCSKQSGASCDTCRDKRRSYQDIRCTPLPPRSGPGSPRKEPRALALFLLYAYRLSGGFLKADRLQNCEETATLSQNASNAVRHARTAIPLQQDKSTRVHVAWLGCLHLMAYRHPLRPGAPAVRDNSGGDSRGRVGLEVTGRQRCRSRSSLKKTCCLI